MGETYINLHNPIALISTVPISRRNPRSDFAFVNIVTKEHIPIGNVRSKHLRHHLNLSLVTLSLGNI